MIISTRMPALGLPASTLPIRSNHLVGSEALLWIDVVRPAASADGVHSKVLC